MKNYFGSYPEDMIRDIDNKLNEWANTSAEWSVKLGTLASVLSISASQTWMIPGWGGTIVTTPLIVSVAATISGAAGMIFSVFQGITGHNEKGLDGKKLSKEESEFRKNAALSNGFESALGMILGGSSWVSGSNSQTNINNSKNEGDSGAGSSVREELLGQVENSKLKNAVNEIYRPGATIGDGGLADAVRHGLSTGEFVGGKSHVKKAMERVTNLENIIKEQELSGGNLEIANKLLNDLKNALGGK